SIILKFFLQTSHKYKLFAFHKIPRYKIIVFKINSKIEMFSKSLMWNDSNKGVIHLSNKKQEQLKNVEKNNDDKAMTTNNCVKISEDENTLTVGERGPSLLEDFHFREKIMHFDHERIPERIVHARGFGAHGEF